MPIIVLQHADNLGPGRLGLTLRDHGFKLDIRRPDRSPDQVPSDLDDVEGVVCLGGEQNVTDIASLPWMQREADLLKAAHARQLPVIGICLGAQLIAHALGGKVAPAAQPEWGLFRVRLNPTAQVDSLLAGIPWDAPAACLHNQEVIELPPGATLLASSDYCKNHTFRAGIRTYAFIAHFEMDRTALELHTPGTPPVRPLAADFARTLDEHYPMFARVADRLCVSLAANLFPLQRRMSA